MVKAKDHGEITPAEVLRAKEQHDETFHEFSKPERLEIRKALLSWYHEHKRAMPWRQAHGIPSPVTGIVPKDYPDNAQRAYEVWISEIMLQQTQVKTVIGYYTKWMQKWPTVFDLAKASLSDVNEVWAGLGYYSRARRIHEAACMLVASYDGVLPRTAAQLADKIPGIGRYTAGAIASIAYGEAAELVDGNVVRVLSRLRSIGADPKAKLTVGLHWKLAKDLVDHDQPGDFNQALMEHGATVCLPQRPLCGSCPVHDWCKAYKEQTAAVSLANPFKTSKLRSKAAVPDIEEHHSTCTTCGVIPQKLVDHIVTRYPSKVVKKAPRQQDSAVCILQLITSSRAKHAVAAPASQYLLIQRPATGLLGGLWEFPSVILSDDDDVESEDRTSPERRLRVLQTYVDNVLGFQLLASLGEPNKAFTIISRRDLGSVEHLFSHIKQTYWVTHITISAESATSLERSTVRAVDNMNEVTKHRWTPADALHMEAISTGMKKVFALSTQKMMNTPGKKRAITTTIAHTSSKKRPRRA